MSSWKTYGKIKKLLLSKSVDDVRLGVEFLLFNSLELTPEQFYYLNRCTSEDTWDFKTIDVDDLQKYWHDKRKQEKGINKRRNIQKDKSV